MPTDCFHIAFAYNAHVYAHNLTLVFASGDVQIQLNVESSFSLHDWAAQAYITLYLTVVQDHDCVLGSELAMWTNRGLKKRKASFPIAVHIFILKWAF